MVTSAFSYDVTVALYKSDTNVPGPLVPAK